MRIRWWLAFMLLFALPVHAGPLDAPMPPADLDGQWERTVTGGEVHLTWVAPTDTGSAALAGYKVYRYEDGVPLGPVQTQDTTYSHTGIDAASHYVYYVTAVNANGEESLPSNPVVLGEYPPCAVFTWSLDPPHVTPRPHCVLP